MLIAHISDLHLLSLDGVRVRDFFNQRVFGGANLLFNRASKYPVAVATALMDDVNEVAPDHVIASGDLTNLTLRPELELVNRTFARLSLPRAEISVVPGNHDCYTIWAAFKGEFRHILGPYIEGDLPRGRQPYPYVRLRGDVAVIGVNSSRPTPPLMAFGTVGPRQLERLERVLLAPEVRSRFRLVMLHHPPRSPHSHWHARLTDGEALTRVIRRAGAELVVHGHLHRHCSDELEGPDGPIPVIGVASSTWLSADPNRRASYNLYRIEGGELLRVTTRRYDSERGRFAA